jgi:hypothetical protein
MFSEIFVNTYKNQEGNAINGEGIIKFTFPFIKSVNNVYFYKFVELN